MPHLGQVRVGSAEKDVRPDNPDLKDILTKLGYTTDRKHVNVMCGKNIIAARASIRRYGDVTVRSLPNEKRWRKAWDMVEETLKCTHNSRVSTWDEVKEATDLTKNAGLPWSKIYPDKKHFHEEEQKWLDNVYNTLLPNGEWTCLLTEALKKELRPIEKVKENKLRTLITMDAAHVAMHKRLTLQAFQKLVAEDYTNTGIALGFSPFRNGTANMAGYLGRFSTGWEFDVSKMDSNLNTKVQMELLAMEYRSLASQDQTEENWLRLWHLRRMLMCAPIVLEDGNVFLKGADGQGGNCTGQFKTTDDNSRFCLFLAYYSWLTIMDPDDIEYMTASAAVLDYNHHVRQLIIGDDWTFTASAECQSDGFTGVEIAWVLYRDFRITLETPSEEPRPWNQLRFCSFGFVVDPIYNRVFHSLNPDRVYSSILQGGKTEHLYPPNVLQRLGGILVSAWGDTYTRRMVRETILKYVDLKKDEYGGTKEWRDAMNSIHNDASLFALYTGDQVTEARHLEALRSLALVGIHPNPGPTRRSLLAWLLILLCSVHALNNSFTNEGFAMQRNGKKKQQSRPASAPSSVARNRKPRRRLRGVPNALDVKLPVPQTVAKQLSSTNVALRNQTTRGLQARPKGFTAGRTGQAPANVSMPGMSIEDAFRYANTAHGIWNKAHGAYTHGKHAYQKLSAEVHKHTGKTIGHHVEQGLSGLYPGGRKMFQAARNRLQRILKGEHELFTGDLDAVSTPLTDPAGRVIEKHAKITTGHTAEAHMKIAGAAYGTYVPQMGYSTFVGTHGSDSEMIVGSAWIKSITNSDFAGAAGTIIATYDMNPLLLNVFRLQQYAGLYEEFVIEHAEFVYAPACSSSTGGGFVAYFEMDPDDTPTSDPAQRMRNAYDHTGAVTGNWWTPAAITMPKKRGRFYVDPGAEERLTIPAKFIMMTTGEGTGTADPGTLYLKYKVAFKRSKNDTNNAARGSWWQGQAPTTSSPTAAKPFGTAIILPEDWKTSVGSTAPAPLVEPATTNSRIYIPSAFQGAIGVIVNMGGTVLGPPQEGTHENLTAIVGIVDATQTAPDTAAADAKNSAGAFWFTIDSPNVAVGGSGKTNTWMELKLSKATTIDTEPVLTLVAINWQSPSTALKRANNRIMHLKAQLDTLSNELKFIETDDQKKAVLEGNAVEDGLDEKGVPSATKIEPVTEARSGAVTNSLLTGNLDEAYDRKKGFERLVDIGADRKLDVSPRSQVSLRQADRVVERKVRRVSIGSYDGFESIPNAEELSLLPERRTDGQQGTRVQRDVVTPGPTPVGRGGGGHDAGRRAASNK